MKKNNKKAILIFFAIMMFLVSQTPLLDIDPVKNCAENSSFSIRTNDSEPISTNITLYENISFTDLLNITLDEYDDYSDIKINISSIEYRTKFENKHDIVGVNTSVIKGVLLANQSDISQFNDNDHSTDGVWVEGSSEDEVELDVKIAIEITNNKTNDGDYFTFEDYYELIHHYLDLTLETIEPPSYANDEWEVCIGNDCYWNISLMYQNASQSEEFLLNSVHKSGSIKFNDILSQDPINLTLEGGIGHWRYNTINFTHPQIPLENFTQYSILNDLNNQSGTWTGNPIFTYRIHLKSIGEVDKWADMICMGKIKITELASKHQFKWNSSSNEEYDSERDLYLQMYDGYFWENNSIDNSGYEHILNGYKYSLSPYSYILLKTDSFESYDFMNITIDYFNITLYKNPPEEFSLNSNEKEENILSNDGNYNLNWTNSLYADNYSLYESNKTITEINETTLLISEGLINNSYCFYNRSNGIYYYIIYAINEICNISSNCLKITVGYKPLSFHVNITETERGTIYLNWSLSLYAKNYSVYYAFKDGDEITQYLGIEGTTKRNLTLTNLIGGSYTFAIFSHNEFGNTMVIISADIQGIVIPPDDEDEDDDDEDKIHPIEINWIIIIVILSLIGGGIGIAIFIFYKSKRDGTIFKTKFK